jgi:uncharacterized protein (DUF4415 family)
MTTRGGARPGSGRPVLGDQKRIMVAVRLPPDVAEWLRGQDESQSKLIERVLRREMR